MDSIFEKVDKLKGLKKGKEEGIIKLQKDVTTLKAEIPAAIRKESVYTSEELRELIDDLKAKADIIQQEVLELKEQIDKDKIQADDFITLNDEMATWEESYNTGSIQKKKSLLSMVIERINITREGVEIEYNVSVNKFRENSEELDYGGKIEQCGRAHGSGP